MALTILTTLEQYTRYVANFESSLSQNVPPQTNSFIKVLSSNQALAHTELYKFGVERALQNLAITATGDDLERIGQEYDVIKKVAEAAVLTFTLPAVTGTVIPVTVAFVGDSNGVRYFPDSPVTAASGVATITATAEETGANGNLNVSDTLTISTQIAGAGNIATVTVVDNTGTDEETESAYRERVLFAIRSTAGGGNATDYKTWSEGVAGVFRAYPYGGLPYDDAGTEFPGDRVVYIQCTTDVQVDGIAPAALLTEVKEAIIEDPETQKARAPLGHVEATLEVYPIRRTDINVDITGLIVDATLEAAAKADISTALSTYLRDEVRCYVNGVDLIQEKNDTITRFTLANIIQDIMTTYGGSAEDIDFDIGSSSLDQYVLGEGELGDLGTISYIP